MLPRLPSMPLKNNGQWIVDNDGLVVIVRGVNMINKLGGYTLSETGFSEVDADILAANGFNVVRVGVIYSAVKPAPDQFDDEYLLNIRGTVDMLASKGIMSLIDFHQDGWGPVFNGEGFPGWATVPPQNGLKPNVPFPEVLSTPAVMEAFDNFWSNVNGPDGTPLQEHFCRAWAHAVEILKGPQENPTQGILGWELLNEPFPANSNADQLTAFTQAVVNAIRDVDSEHMIWYEPWVTFDWGIATNIGPINDPAGRIGFAFHNYMSLDPEKNVNKAPYETAWTNAMNQSGATGDALMATEFGADTNPDVIAAQMDSVDRFMLPAIYWAYWNRTPYVIVANGEIVSAEDMGLVHDLQAPRDQPGNLQVDNMAALTRPYPMFIAGTPQHWNFAAGPKIFNLTYVTAPGGPDVTEIFVPELHFPPGKFDVVAVRGDVQVTIDSQAVLIKALGDTEQIVMVQIHPLET